MDHKKIWALIAIPVVVIVIVLVLKTPSDYQPTTTPPPAPSPSGSQPSVISPSSPNVLEIRENYTDRLTRYQFTGTFERLRGQEIALKNVDPALPRIIVTEDTRVNQIDASGKISTATLAQLEPGMTVSLTMDYDKKDKLWYLRDVYLRVE